MTYAAITGWGKCMPPSILSNADLASLMETDDEWITSRTGIKERRVSHVTGIELSHVAAARALACAGLDARDVELIVYGSCSNDETVPNSASGVQLRLGTPKAGAMDINTACTSFMYGLSTATAMIRTGVVKNAVVIGVELISQFMDWTNRGVAVLFGDGAAAVVLEATDREEGLIGEKLGCDADVRAILRVRGMGTTYAHHGVMLGDTSWNFDGQEIFKRAVVAMAQASHDVLVKSGHTVDEIDLVIPHQANLRIIESVAKRVGAPMERVYVTVQRYTTCRRRLYPWRSSKRSKRAASSRMRSFSCPRSERGSRGRPISCAGERARRRSARAISSYVPRRRRRSSASGN